MTSRTAYGSQVLDHPSSESRSDPAVGALLSVIVPTRNEAGNVQHLVERLASTLGGLNYEVIFVDDSDDETPELVERLGREDSSVRLHFRPPGKRSGGLSGAVTEGLALASGQYVAVMDADLQHPPELLRTMLNRAVAGPLDVVVASRYIPGGSAAGLGSTYRRAVSHGMRWISRILFHERLWRLHDPGSGFFVVRRKMLEGVQLRPVGYKILLEILMRCSWDTMEEVPYVFEDRFGGASKATVKQGLLFSRHALRLFSEIPTAGRLWKFMMVGGIGTAINLGILWALAVELRLPESVAWVLALEASLASNCLLNRSFTWRDRRSPGVSGLLIDFARYHVAVAGGLLASTVIFAGLRLISVPLIVSGLAGICGGSVINYVGCDNLVFLRKRKQPTEPARSLPEA